MKYLKDPKTKEESVSLTLLIISVIALIVAGVCQVSGVVETTGPFLEFFGINAGLYFGRRLSIGSKSLGPEKE
jgi:hypothetical protein